MERMGKVIFDIPFILQSHAESMEKNPGISFAYVLQFFSLISDSLGSVPWLLSFLSTPQPLSPRIFLLSILRITSQIENASKHVLKTDLLI